MARVFTIDFNFQGSRQTALITMSETHRELAFSVQVQNEDLAKYLNGQQLTYHGPRGFEEIETSNPLADELMEEIAEAIERHLENDRFKR